MARWLITWAVPSRKGDVSYVSEVFVGTFVEEAIVRKWEQNGPDSTYPSWCPVLIQPLSAPSYEWADRLVKMAE